MLSLQSPRDINTDCGVVLSEEWVSFTFSLFVCFQKLLSIDILVINFDVFRILPLSRLLEEFCEKHNIRKYPTLKVTRHGIFLRREYRNERTAEAIMEFISKALENPVITFSGDGVSHDVVS